MIYKALKHKKLEGQWGKPTENGIRKVDKPYLLDHQLQISELVLAFGFKAVEDYVLVNVKVEQI